MTSMSYSIRISIESLDFKLNKFKTESNMWISYEFLKCVVQSEVFNTCETEKMDPFINEFEFQGTWKELELILADPLDIHICGSDQVYGRARIVLNNLYQKQSGDGNSMFHFLDNNNQSNGTLILNLILNSSPIRIDQSFVHAPDENHTNHLEREKHLLEREKKLALAEAEFERKIKEAMSNRSEVDIAFREHIRKKEEAVRLVLDNQTKKNEEEQNVILGKYRDEYKKLESRLKVALTEIEAKERDINRQLTEMKVKLSVSKEESQHAVDSEVSKTKVLEQNLNEEKNRANRLEAELIDLRSSFNSSEQAKAENLAHTLQRRIQELELKLSKSNNDIEVIMSEKEHYRLAAHRLAKIVRQERMQKQVVDTEVHLTQPYIIPSKSRKHSEKLINLKAELSKLSTSMDTEV